MDKTKRRGKAEVGGEGEILEPHDSLTFSRARKYVASNFHDKC